MTEISLKEIKEIELSILAEIHTICIENGFRYSICGGTLLGAVRHSGFIPWDDDIDVFMPRDDYDSFIEYCRNKKSGFELVCNETHPRYGYLFAKSVSKQTVIAEAHADFKDISMGVFVDVFPIDGLADTYDKAVQTFNSTKFLRELLVARNWLHFFRSKTRPWYYEPIRFAFFLMSRFCKTEKLIKKLQTMLKTNSFDMKRYSATVCGSYRVKEIMETEIFKEYIDIQFENLSVKAIKRYDEYLTHIYGDYMQLPPESKRETHHKFRAYYKDV